MSSYLLNRRVHYWLSAAVALPLLVVTVTGLLLQAKKQVAWVQPPESRPIGGPPAVAWGTLLAAARTAPGSAGARWEEINRIDIRPGRGLAKVQMKSGWEVQVDLATWVALSKAYRRSDAIEAMHDGSFFAGDWTKLGVFLPSGIALLILLITGIWMFAHPLTARRRRNAGRPGSASGTS